MQVTYKNSFRDIVFFNIYNQLRSPALLVFILVFSAFIVYSNIPDDMNCNICTVASLVVLTLGLAVLFYIGQFVFTVYWIAFNRDSNFLTEHTVELNDNALVESTNLTRSEVRWPGVRKVKATQRYLFLYIGNSLAHCVPAKAFSDRSAFEKFVNRAKELKSLATQNA